MDGYKKFASQGVHPPCSRFLRLGGIRGHAVLQGRLNSGSVLKEREIMHRFFLRSLNCLAAAAAVAAACTASAAPIVFDDFNAGEGHFNVAPNFSGTSVGELATSTADHDATDGFEGGSQKLVLVHDGTATNLRIRHLSGSGAIANNVVFSTTSGTDGFIGYYLKTTNTGFTTAIALDGPTNAVAEMDGGVARPVIADGEWHLYEWDLDNPADWTTVPGIGGGGGLQDSSRTIDSIFLIDGLGGSGDSKTISLDFVALNDAGSVSLIPEPAALGFALFGAMGLLARRRRA